MELSPLGHAQPATLSDDHRGISSTSCPVIVHPPQQQEQVVDVDALAPPVQDAVQSDTNLDAELQIVSATLVATVTHNGSDSSSAGGRACAVLKPRWDHAGDAQATNTVDDHAIDLDLVESVPELRCDLCSVLLSVPSEERSTKQDNVRREINASRRGSLFISRCKHRLCAVCAVRAVANIAPPAPPSADEELIDLDADDRTARPQAQSLKPIATCPVGRCKAPLSEEEACSALVPNEVDELLVDALDDVISWMEAGGTLIGSGVKVSLPPFSDEMAARALRVEGGDELGEWFNDDFQGAYAPFWLYEASETGWDLPATESDLPESWLDDLLFRDTDGLHAKSDETGKIRWICAACGSPESPGDEDVGRSRSTADGPPRYLHCSFARAYGVVTSIQSLLAASESSSEPAGKKNAVVLRPRPKKRSSPYVSGMHSKRYKTVSSGFAKGTGYAGPAAVQTEWRGLSKQLLEKTARADAQAAYWLSRIRCYIVLGTKSPSSVSSPFANSWPVCMRPLLRNQRLPAVVAKILVSDSIMDVGERSPVYVAALRLVNALTDIPSLRMLVTESIEAAGGRCIADLVESLNRQAALLTAGAGVENLDEKTSLLIRQIRRAIRGINRHGLLGTLESMSTSGARVAGAGSPYAGLWRNNSGRKDSDSDGELEELQKDVHPVEPRSHIPGADDIDTPPTDEEKSQYVRSMRKVQLSTVPGLAKTSCFYAEAVHNSTTTVGSGSSLRRIASEVASLFSSLPLDWSSAIIVRVDEDRYDFLRAAICGPEGTPYDSGVFVFDIFLPPTYPAAPPKLKLLTTGGGRVRFNPNLYNCGKVCLSLLGTWSGPGWTPASTLLQVLVSIQSLILVEDPYFNEPGYESMFGTVGGKKQSELYNIGVRRNNIAFAMLSNIRSPTADMRDAILLHFRMKRRSIRRLMKVWFPDSMTREIPAKLPTDVEKLNPGQASSALLPSEENGPLSGSAQESQTQSLGEMSGKVASKTIETTKTQELSAIALSTEVGPSGGGSVAPAASSAIGSQVTFNMAGNLIGFHDFLAMSAVGSFSASMTSGPQAAELSRTTDSTISALIKELDSLLVL